MSGERSASLARLRETFGDGPLYASTGDDSVVVDGITFESGYETTVSDDHFYVVKPPAHVRALRDLAARFRGGVIVELGIAEGGSTALLALEAKPHVLVALDLDETRVGPLDDLVRTRGLAATVHAHYGVDQADRATVARLVDHARGDRPLDLVIDDASHLLDATRASFDVLFPRLRPGGVYLVEDWKADLEFRSAVLTEVMRSSPEARQAFRAALQQGADGPAPAPHRPLSDLAVELVLARAVAGDGAIATVAVDEFWLQVTRGPAELDPDAFRLADLVLDPFHYLS